jgi:hypothetical protein
MAHTIANFELIQDNSVAVEMIWSVLEFYTEPIKILLYKYGKELVKKYFRYEYFLYMNETGSEMVRL